MIIAYHISFGAYGFWLPNDPRRSWSTEVHAEHLRPFGEATKVTARRSHAHDQHDHALRYEAKAALKYPAVIFNESQRETIAKGFADRIEKLSLTIHACAIMPNHVHLVAARRQGITAEEIADFLKRGASKFLRQENMHPLARFEKKNGKLPSCWEENRWKDYLETPLEVRRAIRYVEQNPGQAGLSAQQWEFVVPYEDASRKADNVDPHV